MARERAPRIRSGRRIPSVDICLVRYCRTDADERAWDRTLTWAQAQDAGVLTWDNTEHNIGLVAAREALVAQSTADVLAFMDFDFSRISVNLPTMALLTLGYGVVEPGDGRTSLYAPKHHACSFMATHRDVYDDVGGWDTRFFVAYADWDYLRRVKSAGYLCVCHGPSTVQHMGLSRANPDKREIWSRDRTLYDAKWA